MIAIITFAISMCIILLLYITWDLIYDGYDGWKRKRYDKKKELLKQLSPKKGDS